MDPDKVEQNEGRWPKTIAVPTPDDLFERDHIDSGIFVTGTAGFRVKKSASHLRETPEGIKELKEAHRSIFKPTLLWGPIEERLDEIDAAIRKQYPTLIDQPRTLDEPPPKPKLDPKTGEWFSREPLKGITNPLVKVEINDALLLLHHIRFARENARKAFETIARMEAEPHNEAPILASQPTANEPQEPLLPLPGGGALCGLQYIPPVPSASDLVNRAFNDLLRIGEGWAKFQIRRDGFEEEVRRKRNSDAGPAKRKGKPESNLWKDVRAILERGNWRTTEGQAWQKVAVRATREPRRYGQLPSRQSFQRSFYRMKRDMVAKNP